MIFVSRSFVAFVILLFVFSCNEETKTPNNSNSNSTQTGNNSNTTQNPTISQTTSTTPTTGSKAYDPNQVFRKENLELIDEVEMAEVAGGAHDFYESGVPNEVKEILGTKCRTIPNTLGSGDGQGLIAYTLGKGKGLVAGQAYLLEIQYPEDVPRTTWVLNRGAESKAAFHTGHTIGDQLHKPYVFSRPQSLKVPLSGMLKTSRQVFHLLDMTPDVKLGRFGEFNPNTPENGFRIMIQKFDRIDAPLSAGPAICKIQLYKIKDLTKENLVVYRPPTNLPWRHIAYRGEMYDQKISRDDDLKSKNNTTGEEIKVAVSDQNYFEYHARTMKVLGIDTMAKDMLEWGHNQGWKASDKAFSDPASANDNDWFNQPAFYDRWKEIISIAKKHELFVLPYYEYYGSIGSNIDVAIGSQRRAKPLFSENDYLPIYWANLANADLTDPDFVLDMEKIFEKTIYAYKDEVTFIGAWLRARHNGIPISFSDKTRARFATEANQNTSITKQNLIDKKELRERYYQWWYQQRRSFLVALQTSLAEKIGDHAKIIYTADAIEGATNIGDKVKAVVTDNIKTWEEIVGKDEHKKNGWYSVIPWTDVVTTSKYADITLKMHANEGPGKEHGHSTPPPDPQTYTAADNIIMSYSMYAAYTAASKTSFDKFASAPIVANKNYALNESQDGLSGYFVGDADYAGPYSMMTEAYAVANGNPIMLTYMTSNEFVRAFPGYARAFYAAYLALPALPSVPLEDVSSKPNISVQKIQTHTNGTYYSVVNLGMETTETILNLPNKGMKVDLSHNKTMGTGEIKLTLYPFELRAIHVAQ